MKSAIKYLLVSLLLGVALAGGPLLNAAESKTGTEGKPSGQTKATAEKGKAKRDWYPFGGVVAAVDKQANTISLQKKEGTRVLRLDGQSALEIDGKPATLGSVQVGTYAHGKLHKDSAGNEVITAAKFDKERPAKKNEGTSKKSEKEPAGKTK